VNTSTRVVVATTIGALTLAGTALAIRAATTLEREGRGVSTVTVIEQFTEVEREPASDWSTGLARATITVPAGQVSLVRVRFSGSSFCAASGVLDLALADCRARVTSRPAGTSTWTVASPGSVRFDGLFEAGTEAMEAITAPLPAGDHEIRLELWASRPGTIFGFTDYALVIERIPASA
jgi:hypothetical protein